MGSVKDYMIEIIKGQPDDSSYEYIAEYNPAAAPNWRPRGELTKYQWKMPANL